ncbi:MAG: ribosome recycling factor [Deltaproteobacteria bacterium]|nr:MAG: ribosome recycling factor [Deltaproteobacteria bacterium]
MVEQVLKDCRERMKKTLSVLERDLGKVRAGRASPALLEGIKVEYYGVPTPINQVATISIPESRLIVIQPWDKSIIGEIEKALLKSDLGLTPQSDGKVIRLNIPRLSEERRRELVKLVRKMAEESKVALRNIRRDAIEELRKLEKEKQISQDDLRHYQNEVQKITDQYVEKVDKLVQAKEKEIMEF